MVMKRMKMINIVLLTDYLKRGKKLFFFIKRLLLPKELQAKGVEDVIIGKELVKLLLL